MRVTKGAQIVAGAALLALAVAACGGGASTGSSGAGSGETPVRMEVGEPQHALVPGLTAESEGAEILAAIYDPLVNYNENKQADPNVAESVSTTDNKVWTIKLKQGYTWHDGTKLTAQDYVNAWNWVARKSSAADATGFMAKIDGYADLNPEGEGVMETVKEMKGLKVVDDTTFTVTLASPFSQFGLMLGYTAFYPMHPKSWEADGKLTAAAQEQPVGMGLFKLDKAYKKGTDQTIDLTVYDKFTGTKPKGWTKLQFKLYTSSETAYNDLQGEQLDIHDSIPATQLSSAKTALGERYHDDPDSAVGYIGVPLAYNKEYQNADVRKAISMAIDRKTISEVVFSGSRSPADDFISPVVDGYRQGACGEACTYNPTAAKELYTKAGGPKKIELGYNADGGHKEWIEATANNLRQNLGVEVEAKPFEKFASILESLQNKEYSGLFRMAWSYDYPSPENYLRPIFGKIAIANGSNYGGYDNPEFDKLVDQGDQAATADESVKFYQQADDVLLKDLPYIPVYFYRTNWGHSTKIKNVSLNLLKQVNWAAVEKA
ncbi:ABC transporter substrate-binding protein [Nonomuraea sp. NPDC050663]|uniref:peptide ABC transporter substrate-binding protein n=1 Tax=Nonomuraea sp. NPDC050663 TaxID=3364370 RepID=UPI00378F45E7